MVIGMALDFVRLKAIKKSEAVSLKIQMVSNQLQSELVAGNYDRT